MKIRLQRVEFIPSDMEEGVLYVSEKFRIAMHLCPCGCGTKIKTPIGPTEWSVKETQNGPSLRPSIGNWQIPCQSHYWIREGRILWAGQWTPEKIAAGRRYEEERTRQFYSNNVGKRKNHFQKAWSWITSKINYLLRRTE